jgi:hypothetical protein
VISEVNEQAYAKTQVGKQFVLPMVYVDRSLKLITLKLYSHAKGCNMHSDEPAKFCKSMKIKSLTDQT